MDTPDNFISIPSALFRSINEEMTISLWHKGHTSNPLAASVFYASDTTAGDHHINIHLPWSTGNVYFDIPYCCSQRITKHAGTNDYEGQWNHWVFKKSTTTGMQIFLNGAEWMTNTTLITAINGSTIALASLGGRSHSLTAGAGTADYKYKGTLDEVRIYNRALSASEIKWIYNPLPPPPAVREGKYVKSDGTIQSWDGSAWTTWTALPGGRLAAHVEEGSDGEMWAIGTDGNGSIWRWNGSAWSSIGGSLKQISVGSVSPNIWAVNINDAVYQWTGSWTLRGGNGTLKQVSVGVDGTVWGVKSTDAIYRWNENGTWNLIGGALSQISVGSASAVWAVNSPGYIYQWNGVNWTNRIANKTNSFTQVSVSGLTGAVWAIHSGVVLEWDGNAWIAPLNAPTGITQLDLK